MMTDKQHDTDQVDLPVRVVECLLSMGVSEVVLAAGARNLALAVVSEKTTQLRCFNHFEERAAGFFALGKIRSSRCPVAVVTTSGTAVAELLPAVIESYYQGAPLVVVSADRPKRFRGSGAPQAIEQFGIFGSYAESFDLDAVGDLEDVRLPDSGPLQLNVCLEEPREDVLEQLSGAAETPCNWVVPKPDKIGIDGGVAVSEIQRPDLIVVGALDPRMAWRVSSWLVTDTAVSDVSILAEAISNFPQNPNLADRIVRDGEVTLKGIRSVLRIGGIPTCRLWRDLEDSPDIEVSYLSDLAFSGLARGALALERFALPAPLEWDAAAPRGTVAQVAESPDSEVGIVSKLAELIPIDALVFLGNSLPIREWNRVFGMGRHRCYANRGANGIDGNLSTFLGLAEGETEAWAIVGDLTALYDLSAPWVLGQLKFSRSARLRIVVINNAGGQIFSRLPALAGVGEKCSEMIENRHGIKLEGMASLWGLGYREIRSSAEMESAFDADVASAENKAAALDAAIWEVFPEPSET